MALMDWVALICKLPVLASGVPKTPALLMPAASKALLALTMLEFVPLAVRTRLPCAAICPVLLILPLVVIVLFAPA